MGEYPDVGVIIPTYNRSRIVVNTLEALHEHLVYDGDITFYVGVDGDDNTIDCIRKAWPTIGREGNLGGTNWVMVLDGPRRLGLTDAGLGANLNFLINYSQEEILMQLDDDHQLAGFLDIGQYVKYLIDNQPYAGWIRLYGIASHCLTATLRGNYWYVSWESSGDYSLYIPSNRPHIKHRAFHNFYGLYNVGKTLGETEEGFCHQCKNKALRHLNTGFAPEVIPHVLVPLNIYPNSESGWLHVGESWQTLGE